MKALLNHTDNEILASPLLVKELAGTLIKKELPPLSCKTCRSSIQLSINILRNEMESKNNKLFILKGKVRKHNSTVMYSKYEPMPEKEAAKICLEDPERAKIIFESVPSKEELEKVLGKKKRAKKIQEEVSNEGE